MLWLLTAASVVAGTPTAPVNSCDLLHADYVAPGKSQYRLRFVMLASPKGVVSDIGLHIFSTDRKAELWYYPDEGSAPRVSLISTTNPTKPGWHSEPDGGARPLGSATLIAMDVDGRIAPDAVNSKSVPPRYVIVPELGSVFKGLNRDYRPAAFVFKSCRP